MDSDANMGPWIEAASRFLLNTDFDLLHALPSEAPALSEIMDIMKVESKDKRTIQLLGDKILLHDMLDNIGVPQMPILASMHGSVDRAQIFQMVDALEQSGEEDAFDLVAKPTHLSNCTGSLIVTSEIWEEERYTARDLCWHMHMHMPQRAHEAESAALKNLVPGFIVQPRYQSDIDFGFPIEVRVITLWGKTRVGVWWWGPGEEDDENNTWFVPRGGSWDSINGIPNFSPSAKHDDAVQLIINAMPTLAQAAEKIATAAGAPYLRSDFFLGSSKWGIRLNEVAYCSNIDLRRAAHNVDGFADDEGAIAAILFEGFNRCQRRPAEYFLDDLGVEGETYEAQWWELWSPRPGLTVTPFTPSHPIMPSHFDTDAGYRKGDDKGRQRGFSMSSNFSVDSAGDESEGLFGGAFRAIENFFGGNVDDDEASKALSPRSSKRPKTFPYRC